MDKRYGRVKWGPQGTRERTGASNWRKPLQWNKDKWFQCVSCGWRGSSRQCIWSVPRCFVCPACQGDVEATRQRVFCASLADVFEDNPQLVEWRVDLFRMIVHTPSLDWLLLTKRPENIMPMMDSMGWPSLMDNVWIGTSVENQDAAKRLGHLLMVPAKVHFISAEPLLGEINISRWLGNRPDMWPENGVNWVIVGGESGKSARPMQIEWARSLRDQCQAAGVAYFFKQLGGVVDKRHDLEDMPEDLRIREFPQAVTA